MLMHQIIINELGQLLIIKRDNLINLVGGAEAIKEVDKGHAGSQRRGYTPQPPDLRFLHITRGQHGKASCATGHHIGMIAKIERPCVAIARAATWNTAEVSSPAILYMFRDHK